MKYTFLERTMLCFVICFLMTFSVQANTIYQIQQDSTSEVDIDVPSINLEKQIPFKHVKVRDPLMKKKFWMIYKTPEDLFKLQSAGFLIIKIRDKRRQFWKEIASIGTKALEVLVKITTTVIEKKFLGDNDVGIHKTGVK